MCIRSTLSLLLHCMQSTFPLIRLVLLTGDVVSRKGTMTGGYYDSSKCKLQLYQHVCDQSVKLEEAKQDRVTIVQEIEDILHNLGVMLHVYCVYMCFLLVCTTCIDGFHARTLYVLVFLDLA